MSFQCVKWETAKHENAKWTEEQAKQAKESPHAALSPYALEDHRESTKPPFADDQLKKLETDALNYYYHGDNGWFYVFCDKFNPPKKMMVYKNEKNYYIRTCMHTYPYINTYIHIYIHTYITYILT